MAVDYEHISDRIIYIFFSDPDPVSLRPDPKLCAVALPAVVVHHETIVANGGRNRNQCNMLRSTLVTICNIQLHFVQINNIYLVKKFAIS